jgi:hypothetical protein
MISRARRAVRPLSRLKTALVRGGPKPRRVRWGLFRELTFEIDLQSQAQLWLGLWERETYTLIAQAASRCRWAVDIGAGSGELTVFLLRRSAADRVYSFEPDSQAFAAAQRNLRLNDLTRVDTLILSNRFVATSGSDSVTLDSLQLDRTGRGFLKIDVDGAELDVLESGRDLLSAAKLDLLIETHSAELEAGCQDYLRSLGFRCRVIPNARWRAWLPELRPSDHCRWLWATNG